VYAANAFKTFGLLKGTRLTILRVARCHPWHDGGYDPLPKKESEAKELSLLNGEIDNG